MFLGKTRHSHSASLRPGVQNKYDHLIDKKSSNLNLSLVSEQYNYATRSASLQHLNPESFRINIRKFCPTILGCYYWNDIPLSIRNKPTRKLFKKALYQFYFAQY